jgi:hypothetical protein
LLKFVTPGTFLIVLTIKMFQRCHSDRKNHVEMLKWKNQVVVTKLFSNDFYFIIGKVKASNISVEQTD